MEKILRYKCDDCHNQWSEKDYPDNEEFSNGHSCPSCESRSIAGFEQGEEE